MIPSGPPAEPAGNDRIIREIISVSKICNGSNRGESGLQAGLLSVAAGGCFFLSADKVSAVLGAGLSSEQARRIAALMLPSSSLLDTAFARYCSASSLERRVIRTG